MSEAFHRESAFYTTSNAAATGYNSRDREATMFVEGRPVQIKRPQGAHQGDYDAPVRVRAEGVRWISMVKTDGNTVFYVITCGAGDDNPDSDYARERKQKARALGWFPIASCPIALVANGELTRDHFVDRSMADAHPCEHGTYSIAKPCKHALAEKAARIAAHNAVETERAGAYKDPNAKLIEAQQAQTVALVEALTAALASKSDGVNAEQLTQLINAIKSAESGKPDKPAKPGKGEG